MTTFSPGVRDEDGQVIVFVVAILAILIGMGALVIDGGSWFRAQRHLQTAADAGALAGAQDLPFTSTAQSRAVTYAQTNYSGLPAPNVTFPSSAPSCAPNTCIDVAAVTTAPGFLSRIYGSVFDNVTVTAHARAGLFVPLNMKNVAPIAVKREVACAATSPACYGQRVTFTFDQSIVSSSTIGLINLTCHSTASTACGSSAGIGGNQLKDWIENGYADALPSNQWYGVKTGETIGPVKQGLTNRIGVPLFFPVFDTYAKSGSNYFFHIIGWAAFVIDTVNSWAPPSSGGRVLTGHFVTYIATDLAAGGPATGASDYGVHVVSLIE